VNVWLPLAGYLLGSIPFAFLLARRFKGIDVRAAGSGNVGAANVLRTTGRTMGVVVAFLDLLKGSAAVWLATALGAGPGTRAVTGAAAVLGHVYPFWLRFQGGKGVAVAAGAFGVLAPVATGIAFSLFVVVIGVTRYISLGSVVAAVALPPLIDATGGPAPAVWSACAVAGLIVFRHRANVQRLLARTERRLGESA
jgi:glycerol-3-phosphate acyltransferase PlsY